MKLWIDSETVCLCGPTKLFQFAVDDGPVQFIPLYRGWEKDEPTRKALFKLWNHVDNPDTLAVAYNASFDLFGLYRTFHRLIGHAYDSYERPVLPFRCRTLDLYVPAATSDKSPLAPFAFSKGASKAVAAVRRVPMVAVEIVAQRVEAEVTKLLPSSVKLVRHYKETGDPNLTTLCWTVDGRLSLKNLMKTYGIKTLELADVWPLCEKGSEKPWLPYPDPAIHDPIEAQCDEIMRDPSAPFWAYAELDIHYLRLLYEKLDKPEPDHHSTCTAINAYTRYYGFDIDRDVLERTKVAYAEKVEAAQRALEGINLASSKQRLALLRRYDPLIASSAKKVVKVLAESDRPSASVAKAMLDYSAYNQRLKQVEKVLESRTGRAHPTLRVMGTRTGRMAGEAGLNWQGIPKVKSGATIGIRAAVQTPAVGDWKALEVILGANVYGDKAMFFDIENGIDPHASTAALMPAAIKQGFSYDDIYNGYKAGDPVKTALRTQAKPCNFLLQYFGAAPKLAENTGMTLEDAEKFVENYHEKYHGFAAYKKRMETECCTADTDRWNPASVSKMADSITDLTGYTTRWTFEKKVAEALWALGGKGIKTGLYGSVTRSKDKGVQTIDGAVKSALLGGAIAIQNAVMRQRGNAAVQSLGSNLTKQLMAEIWNAYRVPCCNVHDEIFFSSHPHYDHNGAVKVIEEFETRWKQKLRCIQFDFHPTKTWSDK